MSRVAHRLPEAIPIAIHGDDAGVFEKSKILVLMMHSVIVEQSTSDMCLLLAVLPYEFVIEDVTLPQLYDVIAWSLCAADWGRHPRFDSTGERMTGQRARVAGQPLAAGFQLSFSWQEGDWKFTKETYHLRAYGHSSCCHLCGATKQGVTSYKNHTLAAPWRRTARVSLKDFDARLCSMPCAVPFAHIPGFSHLRIAIDSMHCSDLGFALRVHGSVIVWLARRMYFGNERMSIRLQRLYSKYQQWCRANTISSRCNMFTTENLHVRSGVVFTAAKAADSRQLTNFVYCLIRDDIVPNYENTPELRMVHCLCWGLHQYYELVYRNDFFLCNKTQDDIRIAVTTALENFSALSAVHLQLGEPELFACKPKDHQLLHLAEDWCRFTHINPRFTCCYKPEDFVRIIKRMSVKVDRRALPARVCEHFLCRAGYRWAEIRDGV